MQEFWPDGTRPAPLPPPIVPPRATPAPPDPTPQPGVYAGTLPGGPPPPAPPPVLAPGEVGVPGVGAVGPAGVFVPDSPAQPLGGGVTVYPAGTPRPRGWRFTATDTGGWTTSGAGWNPYRTDPRGLVALPVIVLVLGVALQVVLRHTEVPHGAVVAAGAGSVLLLALVVAISVRDYRRLRAFALDPDADGGEVGVDRWGRPIALAGSKTGFYDQRGNPIRRTSRLNDYAWGVGLVLLGLGLAALAVHAHKPSGVPVCLLFSLAGVAVVVAAHKRTD